MKKRNLIYLVAVIFVSQVFMSCNNSQNFANVDEMVAVAKQNVPTISVEELMVKIDSMEMFNLIDVRVKSEYNHGYIPSAINIARGTLEFNIASEKYWENEGLYLPASDEEFILYCKKGSRSVLAAQSLMSLGYKNVKYIDGGFKKWELTYPLLQEKNLEELGSHQEEEVGGC
ncbi:MAG: rhodanese-like domain-containing protein [Labilibaculum sp.]|nr:rhodanese-like domain-containing protein [Labilibaculum sp.]MBI9059493.1 rhodanese-like domain-containing protein [Labilibaculum sp.]